MNKLKRSFNLSRDFMLHIYIYFRFLHSWLMVKEISSSFFCCFALTAPFHFWPAKLSCAHRTLHIARIFKCRRFFTLIGWLSSWYENCTLDQRWKNKWNASIRFCGNQNRLKLTLLPSSTTFFLFSSFGLSFRFRK